MARKTSFGIVGGLGPLAGADLFQKLIRATPAKSDGEHFDIIIEQHPFKENEAADTAFEPHRRKFYVYNTIKTFETRQVDTVLIGCFLSHNFLEEIQPELQPRIVNIFDAIHDHLQTNFPQVARLGVLTSTYSRRVGLFENNLPEYRLFHPGKHCQKELSAAIYGPNGIKAGNLGGHVVELIRRACENLVEQGVEVIVPGYTELPLILDAVQSAIDRPILDCNRLYAEYAVSRQLGRQVPAGKLGIVGGVGPAATVDFMGKIVARTRAGRDQDHIRLIVEHNPQIPDRTHNLVYGGTDPTIPLYAACKKLEQAGAGAIAIPCNTAHAFIERIQPHLGIPILNMLELTADHLVTHHPKRTHIGLLATTGTLRSGIYRQVLERAGLRCLAPEERFQELVMSVIYGPGGVKADFHPEECRRKLLAVVDHLRKRGGEAILLGCTELPLVLDAATCSRIDPTDLPILDPTEILAEKCVQLFQDRRE